TLITYGGNLSGVAGSFSVASDNTATPHGYVFSATPGHIDMQVLAAHAWTGASSAVWDTGTNWTSSSKPTSALAANFPATIPATGATITLSAGETAHSLNFFNTYALSGG